MIPQPFADFQEGVVLPGLSPLDATWGIGCDSSGQVTPRRNDCKDFPPTSAAGTSPSRPEPSAQGLSPLLIPRNPSTRRTSSCCWAMMRSSSWWMSARPSECRARWRAWAVSPSSRPGGAWPSPGYGAGTAAACSARSGGVGGRSVARDWSWASPRVGEPGARYADRREGFGDAIPDAAQGGRTRARAVAGLAGQASVPATRSGEGRWLAPSSLDGAAKRGRFNWPLPAVGRVSGERRRCDVGQNDKTPLPHGCGGGVLWTRLNQVVQPEMRTLLSAPGRTRTAVGLDRPTLGNGFCSFLSSPAPPTLKEKSTPRIEKKRPPGRRQTSPAVETMIHATLAHGRRGSNASRPTITTVKWGEKKSRRRSMAHSTSQKGRDNRRRLKVNVPGERADATKNVLPTARKVFVHGSRATSVQ
jgi:hypothetical protein